MHGSCTVARLLIQRQVRRFLPRERLGLRDRLAISTLVCWYAERYALRSFGSPSNLHAQIRTSASGTNSPKLPCSPPAPPPVLACQRARISLIAGQNTCDLLRGCRRVA